MTTQLVLGAGQIGRALADVLGAVALDLAGRYVPAGLEGPWLPPPSLAYWDGPEPGYDVLHVAFPWSGRFAADVDGYRRRFRPRVVVVHSTVPVGTSRALGALHSPVTGRHPDLARSLRTFVKFVGGPRREGLEVASLLHAAGVATRLVPDQETTEAGKLWQTLQYGWLIALQKEGRRWMTGHGADPVVGYDEMNAEYSAGYAALGEPYRLPTLANVPGPIGGHCVVPNAVMTDAPLAGLLCQLNDDWTEEETT